VPPPPCSASAYEVEGAIRLPRSLDEATARFRASACLREIFGNEFVEHYAATRDWEVRQFAAAVTDWELERYFEVT
jgi:glutamine synthetase